MKFIILHDNQHNEKGIKLLVLCRSIESCVHSVLNGMRGVADYALGHDVFFKDTGDVRVPCVLDQDTINSLAENHVFYKTLSM